MLTPGHTDREKCVSFEARPLTFQIGSTYILLWLLLLLLMSVAINVAFYLPLQGISPDVWQQLAQWCNTSMHSV